MQNSSIIMDNWKLFSDFTIFNIRCSNQDTRRCLNFDESLLKLLIFDNTKIQIGRNKQRIYTAEFEDFNFAKQAHFRRDVYPVC
jgi:hypothetical protein